MKKNLTENNHEKKHDIGTNQKDQCPVCNEAFVNLKNHIQQIHESSKKKCDICDKEYFSKSRFDLHMNKNNGKDQSK